MAPPAFITTVKEQFAFLEVDFACRLVQARKAPQVYEFRYQNSTTGIELTYEYREAYLFILLYQLQDGKWVANPTPMQEQTKLTGYALDDVLLLRNPNALVKPAYAYGADSVYYEKETGLSLYIGAFAANLQRYAADILQGDFSLFPALEKVVKERMKKFQNP
ncbi:hypothetical protein H8B13_18960 [Hymenobacter sp. BT188]|uniref:hypothetical protein n=1 Tax=Hymenobacter sp. BT188 TaxID=2763504 RepID=UPI00165195AF|nr:hypothetical protein [Hymenobacter sp. BT188]MBC6608909.1 hypothetical protein [Hymenobacter sp. BT188]